MAIWVAGADADTQRGSTSRSAARREPMTSLPRLRVTLAVLVAMLMVSVVVPSVDARVPRAKPYHAGRPITLDTNLLSTSGVPAWAIDEYLKAATPLPRLGAAFVDAEKKYGINARFLLAAAMHESRWGRSYIAQAKHNLFGYNAYDRDPVRFASAYATFAANIDDTARFIKDRYLTPGGRWWGGQPTLRSMQQFWSSSHSWGVNVSRIATSIHLDSIAGRKIVFAAPIMSGTPHPGERASVDLTWVGGAVPPGVEFVATWEAIALDSDVSTIPASGAATNDAGAIDATAQSVDPVDPSPAAPGPNAADANRATTVAARRVGAGTRRIALTVATPVSPGSYRLDLEMRDVGGRPLRAAERVDIPSVEVRVWGDRAVSYDLEPSPDGDGVVVQITNTGRTTIPAALPHISTASRDLEAEVAHSFVTVTASSSDVADPAPLPLITSPLVADLLPGATVSLDVTGIEAMTGRSTNWLAVNLIVLGDSTWLAPNSPAGAWFSDVGSARQGQRGRASEP